ncbi:GBS Bsp-like repeat-containing protein [Streptococcus sp. S784/96/1]|uniref:GBS Bsp-like repeat-containing protein n=1 Tax=Streptococcus sp. S784/96/1 TaxID=2653499 RepID=UPI001EE48DFF|nr:GBS Bsp-like repeat-containing protein [Streptococcus sp. S784/96/1]
MQKGMQTVQRFSIRKCGVGAASVLLGTFLMTGSVLAEEVSTTSEITSQLVTQVTSSEMTNATSTTTQENRDAIPSEMTEQKVEEPVVTVPKVTIPEAKKETPKVTIPNKEVAPKKTIPPIVEVPKVKKAQEMPKLNFLHLGDDYPAYLKNAAADSLIDPWRLFNRECVSFVAYRLSSVNGFTIPGAYGNANEWGPRARREGYLVNKQPAVGAVAWWNSCHVAWVSEVSGDYVTIEEYNYDYTHRYHKRTIHRSKVDGFIHFKDLSASSSIQTSSPVSVNQSGLSSSGTYTFSKKSVIRAEAKTSSPELDYYEAGQSVHYDKVVEAEGYKWLSYLSYSGNRRYIAIEALSVPTKGKLTIKNQNDAKGTFDVVISNVSHNQLKEVQVPIWSDKGGQDDIAWYVATKQSDGTYKVTVDISNHKNDRGIYHVHLYYQSNDGKQTFVAQTTTVPVVTTRVQQPTTGNIKIVNKNNHKGTFDIVVSDVSHAELKEVYVPVWSENAGQDDIAWYIASKQPDGTYKVTVDSSNHKNDRGTYHAHLYYQDNGGNQTYISQITTQLPVQIKAQITLPSKGIYVFKKSSPIKAEAKSVSPTLATYDKGEKVNYDRVLIAEGKQWISYLSYSGARRYIQVD